MQRALDLWPGCAYGEFAYQEFAHAEADRLEELPLAAVEEHVEAELELGRHAELLPELRSLASAHPLRQRIQAQAMLALYRSGNRAEALDVRANARSLAFERVVDARLWTVCPPGSLAGGGMCDDRPPGWLGGRSSRRRGAVR